MFGCLGHAAVMDIMRGPVIEKKRGEREKKEGGRDAPLGGRERGRGYFWHFIFWQNSNKVVYVLPWIVELFTYSTHRVHM